MMKSEILDFDTLVMMSLVLLSLAGHHIKDSGRAVDGTLDTKPQTHQATTLQPQKNADTQNLLSIYSECEISNNSISYFLK